MLVIICKVKVSVPSFSCYTLLDANSVEIYGQRLLGLLSGSNYFALFYFVIFDNANCSLHNALDCYSAP